MHCTPAPPLPSCLLPCTAPQEALLSSATSQLLDRFQGVMLPASVWLGTFEDAKVGLTLKQLPTATARPSPLHLHLHAAHKLVHDTTMRCT